jgi:tetratricopeptide (TPR) repeat protein
MISSTARDLPEHRQKVMDACMRLQLFYPDMMEYLTATDANALEVSLRIVDRADLYLGVFAFRYGYIPQDQTISVTEAEYDRAVERGIPRLIFLVSDKHPVVPADVETGDGAVKLTKLKERLKKERVVAFFDSPSDLEAQVTQALVPYLDSDLTTSPKINAPQPLIHSLPTQQEIEDREEECATILRAMSAGDHRVCAFAAPGGFGKTGLLARVVRTLSPDGANLLERVTLPDGDTIETRVAALLHVDCRADVKLSALFANAGRLIGQEQEFEEIYNSDGGLSDKLQEIFSRLSANRQKHVWLLFDNFESVLSEKGEVVNPDLREFFSSVFAGGHNVLALIVTREVPKFSPRERVTELETVGRSLFEGLPLEHCVAFLKKNGAAEGLVGSDQEIDGVLKEFAERVHRIPLALVWAIGYLQETGFTLRQILDRPDLFENFDQEQERDSQRYENKGMKRLHYEQLTIQPSESLPLLRLLAFFKRAVPKGALAHLLDEIELNKTLTRLERNKLITHKESADAYTRYLKDPLEINLYGLHPVICENEFFDARPDDLVLYETAAKEYGTRAYAAVDVGRFAYGLDVYDCAEKLYAYLTKETNRGDLLWNCAEMLMNKGIALANLTRLGEAIAEYDKAVGIYEWLVNVERPELADEQRQQLAHSLALAYMNRGIALAKVIRLGEAIVEFDKAIAIYERLINEEQQTHPAKFLALTYMNKGNTLVDLTRLAEALAEYDKAVAIYERLVAEEQQADLAGELANSYMNKGNALQNLNRLPEAIVEYDKSIAIYEQLVTEAQQANLAGELAKSYMNKGAGLSGLSRFHEAVAEYDKALVIYERMVNEEQQAHLAVELANTYMNKANAFTNLTQLDDAIAEYDKSVAILERLVNDEQQAHLAPGLALAYMNKSAAFQSLTRFSEATAEIDKAIAIYERLVKQENQAQLTKDLATAYMSKALNLEGQSNFEGASFYYGESLQARRFCVEQLKMFWIMPELLETAHYRFLTLLSMQRWPAAAGDVLQILSWFNSYYIDQSIDGSFRQAAAGKVVQMLIDVRALSDAQRGLLDAALGDKAAGVRSLIDGLGS